MYPRLNSSPEITRWSDSLKRFKPQMHSKRVSPFSTNSAGVEKKVMIISPEKKRSSSIKAALFQKTIFNLGQSQLPQTIQEPATPELSGNDDNDNASSISTSTSCSSSYVSSLNEDDYTIDIENAVQQLINEASSSSDEYDSDDDNIVEQVSRILSEKSMASTYPNIMDDSSELTASRPLPALPTADSEDDILSKSVELFSNKHSKFLNRYVSTTKLTREAANKGQMQLKRAVTWLGLPVQKMLASSQIQNLGLKMSQTYTSAALTGNAIFSSKNNVPALTLSESSFSSTESDSECSSNEEGDSIQQHEQPFTRELIYGTDSDHFAFLRNQLEQKNSPVGKKSSIMTNSKSLTKRIMYCRVMQIINLASTRDCDYELFIQLNNVTMATKRGVLRKIEKNVSADRPQEEAIAFEVEEPFSLNFIVAARHTNTVFRDGLAKMGIWPINNTSTPKSTTNAIELPVAGFACLNFENKMDILDQGVSRFRLTKPIDKSSNRWLNIELLIDIKVEEVMPTTVVNRFPWSYPANEHSATPSSFQSSEEIALCNPKELAVSQSHCSRGDYLTIYTRRMAHPVWKRYWVTMKGDQLMLYDFTFKDIREPLSVIPLTPLQAVNKPSVDDTEIVGVSRKTGIVLQFDRSRAMLVSELLPLDNDEGLEGKTYVYGDNEQSTIYWRNALGAYVNDEKRKSSTFDDGVDLRFLW